MRALIRDLIPNAPKLGLYVEPHLPEDKVKAAIGDYAKDTDASGVIAMYDATLFGSGKDGALFLEDYFVFQNSDLDAPQTIRYEDIVRVTSHRKLLRGRRVLVDLNQGRATVSVELDFSGRPGAADHVARLLHEAMLAGVKLGSDERAEVRTDVAEVEQALERLHAQGSLSRADRKRLLDVLRNEHD